MKKLLCFLMILLLAPAAYAEAPAPYTPGDVTNALFADAFERGDMLLADMHWDLSLSENAEDIFGEDAALMTALSEALKNAVLRAGIGRIDGGVRVLLAGQYAEGEQQAALDLTLDITRDGLSVMSSAIPEKRLTTGWDTLLMAAGASQEEAEQLLSLRELDMQTLLTELMNQSAAILEVVSQIGAPYGETILAHIAALPNEIYENVPAEGEFPAAATEINVSISAKALGDLIIALADQLAADTTLCAILDAALAQEGVATAQLCQAVREFAAESLTDESMPLLLCLGMDEASSFLYFSAMIQSEGDGSVVFCMISKPLEDDAALMSFSLDLLTATPDGNASDGVSLIVYYPQTATDMLQVQGYAYVYADGAVLIDADFGFDKKPTVTENGLRGEALWASLLMNITDDADAASMLVTADLQQSETAAGEQLAFAGALTVAQGGMQFPLTVDVHTLTENAAEGPASTLTSRFRAPVLGINEYIESYTLYTASYTPDLSAVTDVALETATTEELEALAAQALTSLEGTLSMLLSMLPEALTAEF